MRDLGVNLYQPAAVKTLEGINVSGYFNPGQTDPAAFIRNQYNLSDDFSLGSRQTHLLVRWLRHPRARCCSAISSAPPAPTASPPTSRTMRWLAILLGYVRTFTQGFGEFKDNMINTYSLYPQDDYHVSRRLTLNLGLRYDPLFPWQETKNRIEQFSVSDSTPPMFTHRSTPTRPPVCFFPAIPACRAGAPNGSYNNVAPRVGFAYDLTGDGKTSIRGGGGIFTTLYRTAYSTTAL